MNEPKPLTPKYYRLLEKGEIKQTGDYRARLNAKIERLEYSENVPVEEENAYLRPVQVDEWIEYSKQKPTKEDFEPTGTIECMHNGRPYLSSSFNCEVHDTGYWRSISPPQPAKPKSKSVTLSNGRLINVHADGSVDIAGCTEKFSAESIDAFILARQEIRDL